MAENKGITVTDIQFNSSPSHKGLNASLQLQIAVEHLEMVAGDVLGKAVATALEARVTEEIAKNLPDIIQKVGQQVAVAGIKAIVKDSK